MSEGGAGRRIAMDCERCGKTIPYVEWRDACLTCLDFKEFVELKNARSNTDTGRSEQ